jgi:hypothetical protein
MNTVISPVQWGDETRFNFDEELGDTVVQSLIRNNTFMPNVERVVYNTKTTDTVAKKDADGNPVKGPDGKVVRETVQLESPVLTTIVYFRDGTKVTVKNSDKDAITLVDEKVKLSDGTETTVRTASQESREVGLVYAIVKRAVCGYDRGGNVQNSGFAKFLHGVVKNALRQDVDSAVKGAERKISKAKPKPAEGQKKAKKARTPSFKELLVKLSDLLSRMGGEGAKENAD